MPCLALMPGARRPSVPVHPLLHPELHPEPHEVLMPALPSATTMPGRWVDAMRESAPRAAASAQV